MKIHCCYCGYKMNIAKKDYPKIDKCPKCGTYEITMDDIKEEVMELKI